MSIPNHERNRLNSIFYSTAFADAPVKTLSKTCQIAVLPKGADMLVARGREDLLVRQNSTSRHPVLMPPTGPLR
jgi:hypothetical protein